MLTDTIRRVGPVTGIGVSRIDFSFRIFSDEDIKVVKADSEGNETELTPREDFVVTWDKDQVAAVGGYVTLTKFLSEGESVTLLSNIPYTQTLDLHAEGDFNPDNINTELDRLEAQLQQLKETLSRCAVAPVSQNKTGEQYGEELLKNSQVSGEYAEAARLAVEQAKELAQSVADTVENIKAAAEKALGEIETNKEETIDAVKEFTDTAAFSFRYSENAAGSQTLATAGITPSTNVKAGDLVMNKDGDVFSIASLDEAGNATLSEKLTSLKGASGELINLPASDTTLSTEGGYADAKTTGEQLNQKLDFSKEQNLTADEKDRAATNMGFWGGAIAAVFATYELFKGKIEVIVDAYLSVIVKELILENGGTQEEIDAIEAENNGETNA